MTKQVRTLFLILTLSISLLFAANTSANADRRSASSDHNTRSWSKQGRIATSSSAFASIAEPKVTDHVTSTTAKSKAEHVKVTATGTASSTCDDCMSDASTLQVVRLHHPKVAKVDNAAIAWSQECAGCTSSAISIQIVLIDKTKKLTANNRAFASNVLCDTCQTRAAAFQFVIVGAPHAMSAKAAAAVRREGERILAELAQQGGSNSRRSSTDQLEAGALDALHKVVLGATGGHVQEQHADIKQAS